MLENRHQIINLFAAYKHGPKKYKQIYTFNGQSLTNRTSDTHLYLIERDIERSGFSKLERG